ncbi:MAG TPA: sialidase family protein [Opitutaceae bacterium]|nr:sialidase family protein [Opitutaceae bacterium]
MNDSRWYGRSLLAGDFPTMQPIACKQAPIIPAGRLLTVIALVFLGASHAGSAEPALRNLAREALAESPHPPMRVTRTADKAIDGLGGENPERGWVPSMKISPEQPALLALTWPQPVAIRKVVLRYLEGKTWRFVDYTLARWDGATPPDLGAPSTEFPHQDLFVGGLDGYHTFRIPAMVVSKRGTVLAFCEGRRLNARDFGDVDMLLKRSADGGKTWGALQTVHDEEGQVTIGNPVPIADRTTEDIHLVYARDGKTLLYSVSKDDGATFSAPVDITEPVRAMTAAAHIEWNHVLPGPGHGLQTANGRLVVQIKTAGHKSGGPNRRVGAIFSDDHGRTWMPGGWVPATRGETSESTLFETGDGTIVMNTRWHDGSTRLATRSRDGGLTWSAPEPVPDLPDLVCQGSILRASDAPANGRVYFSNIVPVPTGSEALNGRRNRLVLSASDDDGATWPFRRVVVPGPAGYSDLAMPPGGPLLALFENGRMMYSEKLTLARIDERVWKEERARSSGTELSGERYDFARAKEVMSSPAWKVVTDVHDARSTGSAEHTFNEPIVTRTLLLAVKRVEQPDALAYLQEIEVWGN